MYYAVTMRILSRLSPQEDPLTKYQPQPPWEFLLTASRNSLQSYELTRLSHAANLRKEIGALLDQWLAENSAASVARWLIDQRERSATHGEAASGVEVRAANGTSASDNFFPETTLGSPITPEVV
jgi:hypothetical protein